MTTEVVLLPVPANNQIPDKQKRKKIPRKFKTIFFIFFALYFISTLLGAALVPGRLDIESASFALSINENGASLLCAERCFFALFLFLAGFSFLHYPIPLLFLLCEGVFTGINIKLLMYKFGAFSSFSFAILTSCLILLDVFVFAFCFCYVNDPNRSIRSVLYNGIPYLLYVAFSLLLNYLITLLFQ